MTSSRLERPLPITATFYPLGHALELATDSEEVLAAASGVWSLYPKLYESEPVRLSVTVSAEDASIPPGAPITRGREHLLSLFHGPENCGMADLATGFGFASVTRDVARDHASLAWHFLEALGYSLLVRHVTYVHAACISLGGRAILLSGRSGAGKTCLCYACARRGWTFLSGDICQFARNANGVVTGRPFSIRFRESARMLFPELEKYPVSRRFTGKPDITPPVGELGLKPGLQAKVAAVVFLRRDADAPGQVLKDCGREETLARLSEFIFLGHQSLRDEQFASLGDVVDGFPAYEMTWRDNDEAERVLRTLLR